MGSRSKVREALATAAGFAVWFVAFTGVFWWLGFYSLPHVLSGRGHDVFSFGPVQIPKFVGAGFTYLDMVVFCAAGILAMTFALCVRYVQHRAKLEALRKRGIADFDGDGKQDRFTDRFLDEL